MHAETGSNAGWHGAYDVGDGEWAIERAGNVVRIPRPHVHRFSSTPLERNAAVVTPTRCSCGRGQTRRATPTWRSPARTPRSPRSPASARRSAPRSASAATSAEILDDAAVDECGTPINPQVVEGQVHVAAALQETLEYDEDGELLNGTFWDCHVISCPDTPMFKTDNLPVPSPFTPTGSKGVGERGGAPLHAVCAALQDALRGTGAVVTDPHNPPERVWRLLQGPLAGVAFDVELRLDRDGEGTLVAWDLGCHLSGTLRSAGQRVIAPLVGNHVRAALAAAEEAPEP